MFLIYDLLSCSLYEGGHYASMAAEKPDLLYAATLACMLSCKNFCL